MDVILGTHTQNPALDQAILSAAARQFGELGFARMSMESVTAAAGTTVPSLRRRYRDKAELVAAVIGSLRGHFETLGWAPLITDVDL